MADADTVRLPAGAVCVTRIVRATEAKVLTLDAPESFWAAARALTILTVAAGGVAVAGGTGLGAVGAPETRGTLGAGTTSWVKLPVSIALAHTNCGGLNTTHDAGTRAAGRA